MGYGPTTCSKSSVGTTSAPAEYARNTCPSNVHRSCVTPTGTTATGSSPPSGCTHTSDTGVLASLWNRACVRLSLCGGCSTEPRNRGASGHTEHDRTACPSCPGGGHRATSDAGVAGVAAPSTTTVSPSRAHA